MNSQTEEKLVSYLKSIKEELSYINCSLKDLITLEKEKIKKIG